MPTRCSTHEHDARPRHTQSVRTTDPTNTAHTSRYQIQHPATASYQSDLACRTGRRGPKPRPLSRPRRLPRPRASTPDQSRATPSRSGSVKGHTAGRPEYPITGLPSTASGRIGGYLFPARLRHAHRPAAFCPLSKALRTPRRPVSCETSPSAAIHPSLRRAQPEARVRCLVCIKTNMHRFDLLKDFVAPPPSRGLSGDLLPSESPARQPITESALTAGNSPARSVLGSAGGHHAARRSSPDQSGAPAHPQRTCTSSSAARWGVFRCA